MTETTSASKKLGRSDARALVMKAKEVHIATGAKLASFPGGAAGVKGAVPEMLGRTGNLRAPTIVIGDQLFVGFPKAGFDTLKRLAQ